jgi:hypothetical protein
MDLFFAFDDWIAHLAFLLGLSLLENPSGLFCID